MSASVENFESVVPNAVDFVQSIAEQGYKLETALADLIDNSISAGATKIEVMVDTEKLPFTLFMADNGHGMTDAQLTEAIRFPSSSMLKSRDRKDLGRFGLGLKTASFSQTRCFTVVSKPRGTLDEFSAKTWDIEVLRRHGWKVRTEPRSAVDSLLKEYQEVSANHLSSFGDDFSLSTLVVWRGLYKFEEFISERNTAEVLKSEFAQSIKTHLSLVFHRFMERSEERLRIRLNNIELEPFNPFPESERGVRKLESKNRIIADGSVVVDGIVLPHSSMNNAEKKGSVWSPDGKSLTDMEGIYLYRADRIILSGSWLNLAKRSQRMQLARMRIEIGNNIDQLIHLNIAKSQVEMPRDLRAGLTDYVTNIKDAAEREFLNRTIQKLPRDTPSELLPLVTTTATSRGAISDINPDFPILKKLLASLTPSQNAELNVILRILTSELNTLRRIDNNIQEVEIKDESKQLENELSSIISELLKQNFSAEFIEKQVVLKMGIPKQKLPEKIKALLKREA